MIVHIPQNMRSKKFQNLQYDLGENTVYHQDIKYNYKPLIHLCTYEYCSLLFKQPNFISILMKWIQKCPKSELKFEHLLRAFEVETCLLDTSVRVYIKKGLRIIVREIFDFLMDLEEMVFAPCFIRNFIFTNRGTINMKKTVCEILEKETNLFTDSKFTLACKYFIGDQLITDWYKKLSNDEQMYFTYTYGKTGVMSNYEHFWAFRINNYIKYKIDSSLEPPNPPVKMFDSNGEKKYFYQEIYGGNGMEIQFLWENIISKRDDRENILQELLPRLLNESLDNFIYFLFQLESNHDFNDFFKYNGLKIFKFLFEAERWRNIFVEVFQIIHLHLEVKSHKEIFYFLTHSADNLKEQSLHILKGISEVIAPSVKSYLANTIATFFYSTLKYLVKYKRIQVLEFIFKIIGQGSFHIFLNDEGIKCFEELIKLKMFSYIDKVVKANFYNDDYARLKTALEKRILPICCHYAENDDLESIKKFLKWMFADDKKFKDEVNGLLYQGQGNLIQSIFCIAEICEEDFMNINNFLFWCLGSEKEVIKYKRNIVVAEEVSDYHHCVVIDYSTIKDLVMLEKFKGLDLLFMWCSMNDDKIAKLKKRLLYDYDLLNTIILRDNLEDFLSSYIEFCTRNSGVYMEFQRMMLNDTEFHVNLIESGQYYVAKNLINWCSDYCSEETQILKEKLFPLVIKYYVCNPISKEVFEDFMKWVNIPWTSFVKCHFTEIGLDLLHVNENFLYCHLHFLSKLWSFLISPFMERREREE